MKLFALVMLCALPAFGQFSNARSIWGRPIDSSAPTDGYALVWSASQGKYVFSSSQSSTINAQTGVTYTFVDGDRGGTVTATNLSATAYTLPQANSTTFISGWFVHLKNLSAGAVRVTPTTSTIDGASSLVVPIGGWVQIVSDGTNYKTSQARPVTSQLPHLESLLVHHDFRIPDPTNGNLFSQSDAFSTAPWINRALSAITSGQADPLGGTSAWWIKSDGTTDYHAVRQPVTQTNRAYYNISWYAKQKEYTWTAMTDGASVSSIYFNLATCVAGTVPSGWTGTASSEANGWCRLSVIFPSSGTNSIYIGAASANGSASFAGTNGSGIYIWNAQMTPGRTLLTYGDTPRGTATVPDLSGNGNNGTLNGASILPSGGVTFSNTSTERVDEASAVNTNWRTVLFGVDTTAYNASLTLVGPLLGNSAASNAGIYAANNNPGRITVTQNASTVSQMSDTALGIVVVGVSIDSAGFVRIYVNGGEAASYYGGVGSTTFGRTGTLQLGGDGGASKWFSGNMYEFAAWSDQLSAADVAKASAVFRDALNRKGAFLAPNVSTTNNLVCVGDSITNGFGATSFCGTMTLTDTFTALNLGVNSQLLSDMAYEVESPNGAGVLAQYCSSPLAKDRVVTLFGGTNDLGSQSAASTLPFMTRAATAIRAAGCKVIVIGTVSRTGNGFGAATYDSLITTYNGLLRANWRTFADGFVDLFSLVGFQAGGYANPGANCSGAANCYQGDGIHPSTAGQTTIAGAVANEINRVTMPTAPALSGCGGTPVLGALSTDLSGIITEGTVATGCTLTFGNPFTIAPSCNIGSQDNLGFTYTVSTTALTITNVGALSSKVLNYTCRQ